MIPLPSALMFAAFLLIAPFGVHNEFTTLLVLGLMANALMVALLSKQSSHRQSMALLFLLALLFYENVQSIASWLHIELVEVPILGIRHAVSFVPFFFTMNVSLAVIGAAAASVVAVFLEIRRTCFPLTSMFPEMQFSNAPPELTNLVTKISSAANISPPGVSLIDSGNPVAFITRSRNGFELAVSVGLVESLSPDELEACVAHELAHIKNSDFAIRSFATTARVALFAHPLGHLIEPAVYRAREFLADKTAVQLVGGRESLISALTKIRESQDEVTSQPISVATACLFHSTRRNRFSLFDKHPSLDARISALRELKYVD